MRKFSGDKKKVIILGIIVIVGLMVFITAKKIRNDKELNFFEKIIKDSVCFVERIVYAPIDFIKDQIDLQKDKNKIYKKYKKYDEEKTKEDFNKARVDELTKEIEELKKILDLNSTLTDYKAINATVINRNVGYWYNTLTIDKGSHDGIEEGYAVVVNEGLIGKVVGVSEFNSTIKLLSSDELGNKISVKINIDGKSIYGLLTSYDSKNNVYIIEGISEIGDLQEGSYVTTTGFSDLFPSGILLGSIKKVTLDQYELTKVVEVTPSVNFDDINYVSVLKKEVKQ
ncbi:MAG: rod shape-determining protein MreC [Bacilli bacterium]|nr:rod shape-determining protein MreC [Bacilli bacterium]